MNENDYDGMIVDEVDNKTMLKNYLARRNLGKQKLRIIQKPILTQLSNYKI